jgi:hypothetical protein
MTDVPNRRRVAGGLRIDPSGAHPPPEPAPLAVAVVTALIGSLAADWLLVTLWTKVVPASRGYGHFRFGDYATLTAIGVLAAGAAWPLVCRVSDSPRWLFLRLAVLVTVVLWIPDLVLLVRGQLGRDVAVLMVLHAVVAVVTYNSLVRLAPPRSREDGGAAAPGGDGPDRLDRWATSLAVLVGVEFALGVATLVLVPTGRPTGWRPERGSAVYLAHAVVGLPLTLLAAGFLLRVGRSSRLLRLSAWIGGVGVAVAGVGGVLSVAHPLRLPGAGLMLVGSVAAGFGYLIPTFDRLGDEPATGGGDGGAA